MNPTPSEVGTAPPEPKCPDCGVEFKNERGLKIHRARCPVRKRPKKLNHKHEPPDGYRCPQDEAGQVFRDRNEGFCVYCGMSRSNEAF
jgi:hypothetical protein